MSLVKKIRLKCDSTNQTRCVDERTGKTPVVYRDEDVSFELCLFEGDRIIQSPQIDAVDFAWFSQGSSTESVMFSTTATNASLTPANWRSGFASLFEVTVSSTDVATVTAGRSLLKITASNVGSSAVFLFGEVEVLDRTPVVGSSPPAGPSYYTAVQSDARYPSQADFTNVANRTTTLEGKSAVLYSSQSLTAPQQLQARTNLGIASPAASVDGITSSTLDFSLYNVWNASLTGALTLTSSGTPTRGNGYYANFIQNATGGNNVAWPAGWIISPAAAINPKANASTTVQFKVKRVASNATEINVEPLNQLPSAGLPAYRFDFSSPARVTLAGSTVTSVVDYFSGHTPTFITAAATYVVSGINGRRAMSLTGIGGYSFGNALSKVPIEPTATSFTIALVFDSRSASDARLVNLGPMGLSVDIRSSNLEFGSRSNSANRVSIPFTTNDSAATLAIFTFHASGGASGLVIKHGGGIKTGFSAAANAGTTIAATWELFQNAGTSRFTGRFGHAEIHQSELSWEQTQSLARDLCAKFAIIP